MKQQLLTPMHRRPDTQLQPEAMVVLAQHPPNVPVVPTGRPLPAFDPDLAHAPDSDRSATDRSTVCEPAVRPARSLGPAVLRRRALFCVEYRVFVAAPTVRSWTVEEFFGDARPPTDDDVPIALDGRVLDTPAKVVAYIDEINARRAVAEHGD